MPLPSRRGLDRRAVGVAAAGLASFAVVLLAVQTGWAPLAHLDAKVLTSLHAYAVEHPGFVSLMKAVSIAGSALVYTPLFIGIVIWLVWRRRVGAAIFVALTITSSSLVNRATKAAVDRPRPVFLDPVATARGLSFPSGHAQSSVVACGLIVLVVLAARQRGAGRVITAIAAVFVLTVGFSRLALGVHHVSDVVGGYALGTAVLFAAIAVAHAAPQPRLSRTGAWSTHQDEIEEGPP